MYRIVARGVVAVSLLAGGNALALETASSPASQDRPAVSQNKNRASTAKTERHRGKSNGHKKVSDVRGLSAKSRAVEAFGSASDTNLPVVSPRRENTPSQTPWTGFHIGTEGGRSGR